MYSNIQLYVPIISCYEISESQCIISNGNIIVNASIPLDWTTQEVPTPQHQSSTDYALSTRKSDSSIVPRTVS